MAPSTPPKRSKKMPSFKSYKSSKNQHLTEKPPKIYEQMRSYEKGMVKARFALSSAKIWLPIVFKLKGNKKQKKPKPKQCDHHQSIDCHSGSEGESKDSGNASPEKRNEQITIERAQKKTSWLSSNVILVILLSLVISGRLFAIFCTCVLWYFIKLTKGERM